MKILHTYHIVALVVMGLVFAASASFAEATVGGPTHIGSFKYNKADESVYFTQISESGRGCPPILQKISLVSEQVSTSLTCTQGEALSAGNYEQTNAKVASEILRLTNGFKDLTPISLPKNNFKIDVDFVRTEKVDASSDWILRTHFLAKVYQNNVKIDEFQITGCNTEQPFTFAGYAIPGFEKKIIVLSSTKGDCMEGGYTNETVHVVGGTSGLDKTYVGGYKSERSPLTPSEATLIVFEGEKVTPSTSGSSTATTTATSTSQGSSRSIGTTILVAVIALIAGVLLTRGFGKRD